MMSEHPIATEWNISFLNSTGQPGGDKIVLSRVEPTFIRLEVEAPGIRTQAAAIRHRRTIETIQQALMDLQRQSMSLKKNGAG